MGWRFHGCSHQLFGPPQESVHPVQAAIVPGTTLIPWPQEHQVQAHGISTMLGHDRIRIDLRTPAFAHLDTLDREDHALIAQTGKRLRVLDKTEITQDPCEEP